MLRARGRERGDDAIDVSWTSIRSGLTGCTDETLDAPDADVTAEEGELWNDELGGFWTVTGSNLRIAAANGTLAEAAATTAPPEADTATGGAGGAAGAAAVARRR